MTQVNQNYSTVDLPLPPPPIPPHTYPQVYTIPENRNLYPENNNFYDERKSVIIVEKKKSSKGRKCCHCFLLVSFAFLLFVLLSGIISIGIIFGTPKAQMGCIQNSSRIDGKCECNYGFNGDGETYCDECGIQSVNPNLARIVGGVKADPFSWPSAVLIIFNYRGEIQLPNENNDIVTVKLHSKCGGTLIDRTTVLTAGHCFINKIKFQYNNEEYGAPVQPTKYYKTIESMYTIYSGIYLESETNSELDLNETSSSDSPLVISKAAKLIRHEDYNDNTKINDIALIKLEKPVELKDEIQVACLPDTIQKKYPAENKDSWTVGWGKLSADGDQPDELYNVKLTTYNSSMCSRVAYGVPKNWNAQMCAGEYAGGKDSCQGDSGGSLFVRDKVNDQDKYVSVGIVSYGDGCAEKYKPGIYTRISYYLDWIHQNKKIISTQQ